MNRSTKRWWALIGVGALACAACCVVVPVLAAVGIAGTGALLVGTGWAEPLGYGLIAIGLIGVVVSRLRARRRRSGGCPTGDHGAACGCAASGSVLLDAPTNSAQH